MIRSFLKTILIILILLLSTSISFAKPTNKKPPGKTVPAIVSVCDSSVEYLWVSVKGNKEKLFDPFVYDISNFTQGIYFFQIQAVYSDLVIDYPVNFELIVIENNNYISYELFPWDNVESLFDPDKSILEIHGKRK